ncbi:hypothetical protein Tco_0821181 [Tanacetum coccineum]|uniref:Uncharacterized protein n=1 Tax=Tanacetum coccineum TaxID=301880 RepID=A0ABQ5AEP1_9ASTR
MDDPDITMEEYIELEAEKARRLGQEFNWETATFAIVYNDALTSKPEVSSDFKNEFPAIVYNDALATNHKISFEPPFLPGDNPDLFSVIEFVFPDGRYGVSNPMDMSY